LPRLRRQVVPGGHFLVRYTGKPVRLLLRRVFLRGRFTPIAIRLSVMGAARRSPGAREGDVRESYREGYHDAG
jgi:hypothetical protein